MTTSLPQDATSSGGAPKPPAVGRLAPTPSGRMHLGNAFSAIVAWASARSQGGRVILRIEDLDPRAQDPQNARMLVDDLRWLGIDWDEGPVYQSDRTEVYLQQIDALAQKGITYPCFCTRSELHAATAPHASDGTYLYPGTCRSLSPREVAERSRKRRPATRLMVPPGTTQGARSGSRTWDTVHTRSAWHKSAGTSSYGGATGSSPISWLWSWTTAGWV